MVDTLCELLLNTLKTYQKDDLILYKKEAKYVPLSTEEFGTKIRHLSLGLKELGLEPGDKLIILSETRPEWVIADFATLCAGGITVPIYTSLVSDQIKYIVEDSDAKIVVVSTPEQWTKIEAIHGELNKVAHYLTFFPDAPQGALSLEEVMEKGESRDKREPELFEKMACVAKPDDVVSIIYTSGTTGLPKGVMLTHSNFISNIKSTSSIIEFSDKDTVLSFLPLSHVLERMVTFTYLYKGCTVAYAESIETVAENMLEVKPHIMVNVPRVLEKIYSKVMDNVLASSSLKRKIFFWAVKVGKEYGQRKLKNLPISGGLKFRRNLAHKLVFSKIIEKTGGRVRFFVSGGAPLSQDIAEFFYALGLVVLEGYGLTETSPVISVNTFEDLKFGTVGKPIPGVEVKIAQDGEILTRGPHVMKGYYKREEETEEVIKGGWLHTGDIGHLDGDGFLVITDRKKDLIVTAGGKNVAPQPIENLIKLSPYVSNVVVLGDRRKFISALVVPEFEKLEEYAKFNGVDYSDRADLIRKEEIYDFLMSEIDRVTPNLASYEKVKKIALLERDFEIERGEMTPTLKVKRNIVQGKYKDLIDSLYKEDVAAEAI
ncbi:MAG: AMP-dependent synthetase/ligase [Candidatus Aminicenantales bacterium]